VSDPATPPVKNKIIRGGAVLPYWYTNFCSEDFPYMYHAKVPSNRVISSLVGNFIMFPQKL
jgi:hypothetical protein